MIIFDQEQLWTVRSMATVLAAADVVAAALGADFDSVYGLQHVRFTSTLEYWAKSNNNVIRFRHPDFVGVALTVHELGHTFDRRAGLKPQKALAAAKLPLKAGSMCADMHTPAMGEYTPAEAWANLFADYCLGMLAQNAAGRELRAWMDAHMGEWVKIAIGG